jgi:hypothetical protein
MFGCQGSADVAETERLYLTSVLGTFEDSCGGSAKRTLNGPLRAKLS